MRNTLSAVAFAAALTTNMAASPAFAQSDEIVVTATRAGGLPQDVLGISATVIGAEQLEARQTRAISDVLRDVPGVAVSRAGGGGQRRRCVCAAPKPTTRWC